MDARIEKARWRPGVPLRQQVYEFVREAIVQGSLKPGARLPPSRDYALILGVARNTVVWALERLQFEGYVISRLGDGTYVSQQVRGFGANGGARHAGAPQPTPADLSQRGRRIAQTAVTWGPRHATPVAFRVGRPALEAFPFALWERLVKQTSARALNLTAEYQHAAGHPPLRAAIAEFLAVTRGIACSPSQVLVTSGSQQAIDIVCRLLLDEGDEALVEDPGYLGIRANLIAHGARMHGVAVDSEGMDIEAAAPLHPTARLAFVTPTHQFPLGVNMSLARRLALLQWAQRRRGWVVEDDYDGEFHYAERAMPALCSIDRSGRVLYVGTFSKILHPGMRLGFLVLPPDLVDAFTAAKAIADRHSGGLAQDVLARFITEGHLVKHLRRMREIYHARQLAMIEALRRESDGVVSLGASTHGMHLTHEIASGHEDLPLTRQAHALGVEVTPLSAFCLESVRRGWLFGYAGFDEPTLAQAAAAIGKLLQRHGARSP